MHLELIFVLVIDAPPTNKAFLTTIAAVAGFRGTRFGAVSILLFAQETFPIPGFPFQSVWILFGFRLGC
jgi:hypothetical protein